MPAAMDPERDAQEQEWVEQIRAGNRAAFEGLYRGYYATLLDFAFRIVRSRDVAHDIVQDVFVSLWLRRAQWAPRSAVAAYLYGAVRNHALHAVEHGRVVARLEASGEPVALGTPAAAPDAVEQDETSAMLRRSIDALPERQRSAVLLHFGHGLSTADVARALSVSHTAATNLITRALARLRESMPPKDDV